ncbi:hypothetical protein [Calothrix sp. PCC 7507]|uniref:hypothetical protein n=1 Tax=Calothrix sp. PCC 7507 TaxID=99598 RepID=UPI00029EDA0A|nr:hypothetical protein [Calothrix sp. PCC 7507]AFY32008.1 hypothetical protein Cal7507_1548 [Calothrix sp. PCC 7507]
MANRLRKVTPKRSWLYRPHTGAIKHVSETQAKQGNWLSSTFAIAILMGSAGSIIVIVWLSILFIFNPEQIGWLNKFLPEWAQISLGNSERPQTLKQIQLSLSNRKQIAGDTLPLDDNQENSFLLPVFQQRANCQSNCRVLVALKVYQRSPDLEYASQTEKYYHLVNQLPVTGLDESFVLAADAESAHQEATTSLPLNAVQRFEGKTPSAGIWFYLSGQRQQGTGAIAYGHIVYYNQERHNLQQLLSWKSLSGQVPKWQQVTGGHAKELVIDQTVGLEPQLQIYQVKSVNLFLNPIQLEEISLKPPVLQDSAYQNALLMAESGLWTPAFERLQSLQKQRKDIFPPAAQAQIDMIRLHSQLTKTQAEKSWASPGQQALADLIDGRWQKALQVFEASPQNVPEIAALLKADGGRLWKRTQAALRVNPNRREVQAWTALMLAVQQEEAGANSWLRSQLQITPDTRAYIQGLLRLLNNHQLSTSQDLFSHPSRIVGSVQPMTQVTNAEWLQLDPKADLKLADNEVWYQMTVSAFDNGKRWLNSPFANLQPPKTAPAKFLWEILGLSSDPAIQIVNWLPNGEQQMTTASIKAVQLRGGVLRLLAAGQIMPEHPNNAFQPRPLALTNAALEWVQPSAITLAELSQRDPQAAKEILPTVWGSLQQSGEIPDDAMPDLQQMQQKLGDWPVQVIDLTNNAKPEIVLTISAAAIASLQQTPSNIVNQEQNLPRPRTIILSDSGKIVYTDFQKNSQQLLTAIARLSDDQSLALLVENVDNYSLRRWSEKNQRFE